MCKISAPVHVQFGHVKLLTSKVWYVPPRHRYPDPQSPPCSSNTRSIQGGIYSLLPPETHRCPAQIRTSDASWLHSLSPHWTSQKKILRASNTSPDSGPDTIFMEYSCMLSVCSLLSLPSPGMVDHAFNCASSALCRCTFLVQSAFFGSDVSMCDIFFCNTCKCLGQSVIRSDIRLPDPFYNEDPTLLHNTKFVSISV